MRYMDLRMVVDTLFADMTILNEAPTEAKESTGGLAAILRQIQIWYRRQVVVRKVLPGHRSSLYPSGRWQPGY